MSNKCLILALLTVAILLPTGCLKRRETGTNPQPWRELEYDYVLAIVLDCSGSFDRYMTAENPAAFRFFSRATDKFFRQRVGYGNDRLLLTQLSTGNRPLLWDGKPEALRKKFHTPETFATFLRANSTRDGSNCYAAIARTLDYLTKRPGITKNTTVLTLVLSDMQDNDPNAGESRAKLQDALRRYHDHNGFIGLYWVDQKNIDDIDRLLDDAGYADRVWMGIIDDPELPDFEDI